MSGIIVSICAVLVVIIFNISDIWLHNLQAGEILSPYKVAHEAIVCRWGYPPECEQILIVSIYVNIFNGLVV